MELATAMPNALKLPLFQGRQTPKIGETTQLAVHNSIFGKPTKKQASTQLIRAKPQDTTDVKEQIAVLMISDIKECVIRTDVG